MSIVFPSELRLRHKMASTSCDPESQTIMSSGHTADHDEKSFQKLIEQNNALRAQCENLKKKLRIALQSSTTEGAGIDDLTTVEEMVVNGTCPIEPKMTFWKSLYDRAIWLVGLLVLQSCSSIILSSNEMLLKKHPVIIFFLTMLVGAGGNAGNQSAVRVIRGIAVGAINEKNKWPFFVRELRMAVSLSILLGMTGFLRAVISRVSMIETLTITFALMTIVFISVVLGAILPLILQSLNIDPAHSSTTIQVIMDILGVLITCTVSTFVLDMLELEKILA
eukprot:gene10768-22492_t